MSLMLGRYQREGSVKQQELVVLPTTFHGAATGLAAGLLLCGLREGMVQFAAQAPHISWKGLCALSGVALIATFFGRRGESAGESAADAPVAAGSAPARPHRLPRSRRLWGSEDGFTTSGPRRQLPA